MKRIVKPFGKYSGHVILPGTMLGKHIEIKEVDADKIKILDRIGKDAMKNPHVHL